MDSTVTMLQSRERRGEARERRARPVLTMGLDHTEGVRGDGATRPDAAGAALRDLVAALPDPVLVSDRAGGVVLANHEAHSLLGPDLATSARALVGADGDVVLSRGGEGDLVVEVHARPLGDTGLLVHTVRDVTERRQTEERYRILTELVSDMAYVARVDDRLGIVLEWVTDSFERITGYTAEEWQAMGGWKAAIPPSHLDSFAEDVAKLAAGEAVVAEGPFVDKRGRERWLRSWAMPALDADTGGVIRIYGAAQDITESRAAEHAYRLVSEAVSDVAFSYDVVGGRLRPKWVHEEAYERLTGYSLDGVIPEELWSSHAHRDDLPLIAAAEEEVLRGHRNAVEFRFRCQDGTVKWVRIYGQPVVDETSGSVVGVYGAGQDVTAWREAEERYRAVSTLTSDVAFAFRLHEGPGIEVVWATEGLEAITGYGRGEVAGPLSWHELTHPDDRGLVHRGLAEIAAGRFTQLELRIIRKDGAQRWLRVSIRPAPSERDMFYGAAEDITARKQAEAAMAESEARLREAQAVAHLGSWRWDAATDTVEWSEELYRIHGVSPDGFELTLARIMDQVHPEDRADVLDAVTAALREAAPFECEYRILRPNDEVRWLLCRGRVVEAEGGPAGLAGVCLDITERREAEERYRVVSELTSDVAYSYHLDDAGWPVVDWITEGMERITGYTADEAIAMGGWAAMVVPDDREAYDARLLRVLSGASVTAQFRIRTKSGETRWLRISATPVTDARTGGVRVFGAAQDVTDQQLAEQALGDSEARLRAAQNLARLGSWRYELGSETIEWSDELYQIAGYDPAVFQPTVEGALDMIHPSDRPLVVAAVDQAVEHGVASDIEYRFFTADGAVRWVMARTDTLVDGHGTPVAVRGTCLDITERKEEEDRYRAISELISDVAYSFRIEGGRAIPEWITEAFSRLTGYTDERALDILVHRGREIVHPDDWGTVVRSVANVVAGNEDVCEYRLITKSGEQRWMRAYARPVIEETSGEVIRVVGAAQDVTEHRRVEEALRRAYHRERSAALELRKADRLKDEFLTTASHELRTPLTSIVGFASALARLRGSMEPATQDEIIEKLERNALQLGHMVERLLDFSRLQSGTANIESRKLRVDEAVLRCLEAHAAALAEHVVDCDLPPDGEMWADPQGFQHVLGNVLTNAAKYSPAGSTITIRVRLGDEVVVTVTDEGPGVTAEVRARLFERFYRGPDQPAGQRGSGVGLAIARTYVELMGGRIWVESEPGIGSTFAFTLPLGPSSPGSPRASGSTPGHGTRVRAR